MGFKARAHDTTAKANVRESRPAIEAYFAENDGTAADADLDASTSGYEGMTIARLQAIDSGLSVARLAVGTVTPTSFCVSSTNNGNVWHQDGPSAPIVAGPCP
jgi:Tfp pilus assembly protein PilE